MILRRGWRGRWDRWLAERRRLRLEAARRAAWEATHPVPPEDAAEASRPECWIDDDAASDEDIWLAAARYLTRADPIGPI